jgi:hypothetical protein
VIQHLPLGGAAAAVILWLIVNPSTPAQEPKALDGIRVEYTLKTPRGRDPVLGGARDKVFFNIWLPSDVKVVRGAVCNPFSRDEPVRSHWKAACQHWKSAYLQTDFDAVKKEELALLKMALNDLAKRSGHPELANLPLCFTGMSRGGGMSMQLAERMPERTIASVPVCLEVGPSSEMTRKIPVLTIFGEKDGMQMTKLLTRLPAERKLDARWGVAVQWGRRHEFGQANNLSFVFLDDVIARRLPSEIGVRKPVVLKDLPLNVGWLGDPVSWASDGKRALIHRWNDFKGDRTQTCWLPSERTAAVWQALVSATKDITITEPAGLGDGQKFGRHHANKPVAVRVMIGDKRKPTRVELWNAHQRLAERREAPWTFEASLQPGVHSLYVIVHEPGQPLRGSRPHTIVVAD